MRPTLSPKLDRSELDHLAKFHSLDPAGVETLMALAQARPGREEARDFLGRCLRIGGVLSLASALVFFVAANWSRLAVFGRFALVELVLVMCGVLAFWKPPPAFVGRAALFMAFIATGALLALFGQTYQTGADVYELFLSWTLLGLPLALASRWSLGTAAWVLVFNLALLLYCGWQPAGGMLWALLGDQRRLPQNLVMGAAWLNLLLWLAAEWRRPETVPAWVRRLLLSCAFLFVTWAGIQAVIHSEEVHAMGTAPPAGISIAPLGLLAAMALTVAVTLRRREDVYPLAVVMGSFVAVTVVWLGTKMRFGDEGMFLLLALYLIGVSTAGGRWLVTLLRRWRAGAQA